MASCIKELTVIRRAIGSEGRQRLFPHGFVLHSRTFNHPWLSSLNSCRVVELVSLKELKSMHTGKPAGSGADAGTAGATGVAEAAEGAGAAGAAGSSSSITKSLTSEPLKQINSYR